MLEREMKNRTKSRNNNKVHTVTVCVVPPPENVHVWQALSEIRFQLKDPGYYRWPPHVNLLYPFLDLPPSSTNADNDADNDEKGESQTDENWTISSIVEQLESATRHIVPFSIQLDKLGIFGCENKGVLWLHPNSVGLSLPPETCNELEEQSSPLIRLQTSLEKAFPMCKEQSRKGGGFTPHMTVSHFPSFDEALYAKGTIESSSKIVDTTDNDRTPLEFVLDRIYLLQRKGDEGQFLRVAEIALGSAIDSFHLAKSSRTQIFNPPQPFPDMPDCEAEWVYEERMILKSRRKNNRKIRRGNRRHEEFSNSGLTPDHR
jgi:hypothetical protein